jgi:hypothetical protein
VILLPNPNNYVDSHALEVRTLRGGMLGHIRREDQGRLPRLRALCARVSSLPRIRNMWGKMETGLQVRPV